MARFFKQTVFIAKRFFSACNACNDKKDQVGDVDAYMARCFREGFGKRTAAERKQVQRRRVTHEIKRKQEKLREKIQT